MAIGMGNGVRVRFAPSPTGGPHVGNIRTAIYDWLLARGSGGAFVIRVEDTDQGRKVEGAIDELLDALTWLGIEWDEGPDVGGPHEPYVQSERLDLYHDAIASLMDKGAAYRCYCKPERLSEMREQQQRDKGQIGYDRLCKGLSEAERGEREAAGLPSVVRFAMPSEGVTRLDDIVRGEVSFENGLVDDFVMLKGDGFPTYHLANVVDDYHMEITHVLRAEEWLSSAPRHLQIYAALGWTPPTFAHLPVILAPDRSKLSKRHGATSIMEYREQGYIAPALVNFLTLLGWSLDDKTEIMSSEELTKNFSLERVSRSGALFDAEKLAWMNGHYIREMSDEDLADALLEYWGRYPVDGIPGSPDRAVVVKIAPLVKVRLKTLADAAPLVRFFFADQIQYEADDLVQKKMDVPGTKAALDRALEVLRELPVFDTESIETALRALAEDLGIKVGQLLGSIRIATTGLKVAPPLFETLEILGRDRSVSAVKAATKARQETLTMPVALHSSLDGGPVSLDILSGLPQELAFSVEEYRGRVERVRESMRAARVDVLLVKEPSNVLYLCGLQSFSMYGGECIILPLDGEPTLVVHPPEAGTALLHTWITDVHTFDASATHEQYLASLLRDKGLDKAKIAIEKQSIGVTVAFQESLAAQLSGVEFADGSALVTVAKTLKSPAEIAHLRKSAAITDLGAAAAIEAAGEGKTDNDIAAAANFALIQGGSEYMAVSPIVTSGRRSGILHSTHKRVPLRKGDSILIEMGASYQRYTAPTMRTISIGDPDAGVIRMAGACLSALDKVIEAIRPGVTSDEVARAGWEGMDLAGPGLVFHGVFGYAVGCNFPPTWADGTAFIKLGDHTVLQPGMVFHHPVALRRLGEYGVAFSETSVVTEDGCEVLTSTDRRLFIR